MTKRKSVGRPTSENPLSNRKLVRLSDDDVAEFDAECKRLTARTGQDWTLSAYLRMAGRAMKGKHLS